MIVGSMANGLCAGGGFCAGSEVVVEHQVGWGCSLGKGQRADTLPLGQRINGSAFVFSAALPALLATAGSAGIDLLRTTTSIFEHLQENIRAFRACLAKLEGASIFIPSDPSSALIHIFMLNPPTLLELEEKLLQDVVDDALSQGVMITRASRLRGQETFEPAPSLKIMISSAFTKKEVEKAGGVVKASLTKCLGSEWRWLG